MLLIGTISVFLTSKRKIGREENRIQSSQNSFHTNFQIEKAVKNLKSHRNVGEAMQRPPQKSKPAVIKKKPKKMRSNRKSKRERMRKEIEKYYMDVSGTRDRYQNKMKDLKQLNFRVNSKKYVKDNKLLSPKGRKLLLEIDRKYGRNRVFEKAGAQKQKERLKKFFVSAPENQGVKLPKVPSKNKYYRSLVFLFSKNTPKIITATLKERNGRSSSFVSNRQKNIPCRVLGFLDYGSLHNFQIFLVQNQLIFSTFENLLLNVKAEKRRKLRKVRPKYQ